MGECVLGAGGPKHTSTVTSPMAIENIQKSQGQVFSKSNKTNGGSLSKEHLCPSYFIIMAI